ncbi:MAG: TetR/AcrR family transcriptional regulator [Leptospiraceae bacterium]|nr:TetR/AcrR family transcriptional regulator [Leptospiraceae bacterium]
MEKNNPASPRVARRRERLRHHILESSSALICRIGLDRLSFDQLAQVSDVARGTLYSFFKNKEALLEELYKDVSQQFRQGLENLRKLDDTGRLEGLLNLYCDLFDSQPDMLIAWHQIGQNRSARMARYWQQFTDGLSELFQSLEGHLRSNNPGLSRELFERTSIPSLQAFAAVNNYRSLYVEHFTGLLLKPQSA